MNEEFFGYEREDGSVGIRNKIVILPSVVCSSVVAQKIAEKVENAIALSHQFGCGHIGPDFEYTVRTLAGLASNPNVFGVLVVGLGCENVTSSILSKRISKTKKPVESFDIQEINGGTIAAIEKGIKIARKMAFEAKQIKKEPFDYSHLVLGLECGGSDAISGITSNPVVGIISDKIINLGGTSILPEFTEWIGTEHLLIKRAINQEIADQIIAPINMFIESTKKLGIDFRGTQPTPGNIKGGLTTIEEKSLGNIAKSGKSPIQGVVEYSTKPKGKGLWLMIEPGLDVESMTGLAAAGAQLIIMTTGQGTPTGNPISPVIKICGNPKTCQWMSCNIDVDASEIITKNKSIDDISEILWKVVKKTCNGKFTKNEILGHYEMALWRLPGFGLDITSLLSKQ
ncbi:MAG: UxaA family hydrolase [Candidatus Helarchaeota archaeon]